MNWRHPAKQTALLKRCAAALMLLVLLFWPSAAMPKPAAKPAATKTSQSQPAKPKPEPKKAESAKPVIDTSEDTQPDDAVAIKGGVSIGVPGEEVISSLSLRDTDVPDVLYMLAEQGGFNIIVDSDVGGTISLDLKDVSINKALEYIFTMNDLTYHKDGNTLIVSSNAKADSKGLNKMVLKSIPVKYSNSKELSDVLNNTVFSITRAGGNKKAISRNDPRTNSIIVMGSKEDVELAQRALKELDFPLVHKSYFLKYADPLLVANNIAKVLFPVGLSDTPLAPSASTSIVPPPGQLSGMTIVQGGPMTFIANPDNNTITMIGSAEQVEMAEQLLYDFDIRPAQVVLQVAIVELSHNRDKSMRSGVNPLANRDGADGVQIDNSISQVRTRTIRQVDGNNTKLTLKDTLLNPSPSTKDSTGLLRGGESAFQFNGGNSLLLWDKNLGSPASSFLQSARISVSNALTKGKILSNPTIMAISGQTSSVNVTRQVFAGSRTTVDQVTGIASTTPILTSVGISLNVTPTVLNDGTVTMKVQPTVSAPSGQVSDAAGNNITLTSSTTLNIQGARVKDGQTLILAGLIRESQTSGWTKVPFLSDIPIIGAMFRATSSNVNDRSELIILVTPHILREDGVAYFRDEWRGRLSYDRYSDPQKGSPQSPDQAGPGQIIPASNTLNKSPDSGITTLESRAGDKSLPLRKENIYEKRQSQLQLPTYSEVLK